MEPRAGTLEGISPKGKTSILANLTLYLIWLAMCHIVPVNIFFPRNVTAGKSALDRCKSRLLAMGEGRMAKST